MAKVCKLCGYVPENLCNEIKELEYKLKVAENENKRIKRNWTNSNAQHKRYKRKLIEECLKKKAKNSSSTCISANAVLWYRTKKAKALIIDSNLRKGSKNG